MLAITAATLITMAGFALAYLGQLTLKRFRVSLVVITVGMVASTHPTDRRVCA